MFYGGMGQVTGNLRLHPDLNGILNRHPFLNVAHGCLLEGMALPLGKARLHHERVAEMQQIA
jgi:hypothetical protein